MYTSFVKDVSVFLRFLLSCGLLGVFHNSLKVSVHLFSDKLLSSITAVSIQTSVSMMYVWIP